MENSAVSKAQTYSFFSIEIFDPDFDAVVHEVYLEGLESKTIPSFMRNFISSLPAGKFKEIGRDAVASLPKIDSMARYWKELPVRLRHELSHCHTAIMAAASSL